jgi:hypothetical protein
MAQKVSDVRNMAWMEAGLHMKSATRTNKFYEFYNIRHVVPLSGLKFPFLELR